MIKTKLHFLLMIFLILLLLLSCCEGCRVCLLGATAETVNPAVKTDFPDWSMRSGRAPDMSLRPSSRLTIGDNIS